LVKPHRVSDPTRNLHQTIPWTSIVGLRHRLVHDYVRIDVERVGEVVEQDLPTLTAELERIAPTDDET
jgi:uncharacterized protein with HEPN domain